MKTRPRGIVEVPIAAIEPSPINFRTRLDRADLEGLAASIREQGLLHPILLRPHPDPERFGQYQIVCGERRYFAWRQLADEDPDAYGAIPARIEPLDDTQALAAMLQENEQRADWSPYERAAFFRAVYDGGHFGSMRKMAAALGLGLTTLHRYLRIFDLPEGVVTRFRDGALSMSDVEVILDADPRIRVELADWLSQRDLRKDEARRLSRRLADPAAPRDWVDAACEQLGSETVEVHPATDGGISLRIVAADPESLRQSLTELLRRVDRLDSDSHGRSAERF